MDILAQALGINVRVFPFQIPSFGSLVEDRIGIARAVQGDLERRGMSRGGDVDPDVVAALQLIADFQVAIAVLGTVDGGREIYARAAATGRVGVVARQEQQVIQFELIRPEAIARAAVGLLPAARPGPGQSVTITQQAPVPARHRRDDAEEVGFAQPVRSTRNSSDAQLYFATEILRKPRKGGGYFVVSGRDRNGKETTAPGLSWIDTPDGRYLVQTRDGADGQLHSTFAPADEARLTHQLNEHLRALSA